MSAPFTIQIDDAILNAVDALAEKTDRPRDALVVQAIEDYVALHAWQIGKIEQGIAAADRGEFAPESEVNRVRAKFAR